MIVVSNHLKTVGVDIPQHYVTRINVAWIKSVDEMKDIICSTDGAVFLDYPTGRYKPPFPIIQMQDAVVIANEYQRVKYFAVSNAEDEATLRDLRQAVRKDVEIVPKIETEKGVDRVAAIIEAARSTVVMLDKDDLYLSIGKNNEKFFTLVRRLRKYCDDADVTLLELAGVVFYG